MLTLVNPSCSLSNYESCFFDVVVSTVDQQKEISAALRYSEDCMGRSVGTDIPRVGLPSGDRLEPSKSFRDVGTFELMPVPFTARVWRGSKEDRITHVSPLFSIEGVSLRSLCIDLLHTWALGPCSVFTAFVIWHFLRCGVFASSLSWLGRDAQNKIGLLHIKSLMFSYYRRRAETDQRWKKSGSQITEGNCSQLFSNFSCLMSLTDPNTSKCQIKGRGLSPNCPVDWLSDPRC